MKRSGSLTFVLLTLAGASMALGAASCSDSPPSTSSSATGTGGAGGSGGMGGAGGAGGAGGEEPPPPPPPPPQDAIFVTAEPEPTSCNGVDMSMPSVVRLAIPDENGMASPTHVRDLLGLGIEPLPGDVHLNEFLNYYSVSIPAPAPGSLDILPEIDLTEDLSRYDFAIALRASDPVLPRRPISLTFVVDTSGSMQGPSIERAKNVIFAAASQLAAGDIVGIATWEGPSGVALDGYTATGPNDPIILSAASSLEATGGTDLESGLATGYGHAKQHYGADRLNRVIVITDGGASISGSALDLVAEAAMDAAQEGIYLVGVATGPALSFNDSLLRSLTDRGRGSLVYLDSVAEASRMFVNRFDEVMDVAARDVELELTLPWYFRARQSFGNKYVPVEPVEEPARHLAPGDVMISSQVLRACDPAVVDPNDAITVRARWKTPLTYAPQTSEVTITIADLIAAQKTHLPKIKAILAYANALDTPSTKALIEAHDLALAADPSGIDPELIEIATLLQKHPQY